MPTPSPGLNGRTSIIELRDLNHRRTGLLAALTSPPGEWNPATTAPLLVSILTAPTPLDPTDICAQLTQATDTRPRWSLLTAKAQAHDIKWSHRASGNTWIWTLGFHNDLKTQIQVQSAHHPQQQVHGATGVWNYAADWAKAMSDEERDLKRAIRWLHQVHVFRTEATMLALAGDPSI